MLKEIKIKYYFEEEDKEIVKKWLQNERIIRRIQNKYSNDKKNFEWR